jgi:hypothetical protein
MALLKPSLAVLRYLSWTAVCELPIGSTEPFFSGAEIQSWTAVCDLPIGSTEPFFGGAEIPVMDSRL